MTACIQRRLGAAEEHLQAGLRLARELGDQPAVALFLSGLAEIAHLRGDDDGAQQLLLDCLSLARSHDMQLAMSYALLSLGRFARLRREHGSARARQAENLALSRTLGDSATVSYALDELAAVATAEGEYLRAAQLFGSAASVRARSGAESWLQWRDEHERAVGLTRFQLGCAGFERAWLTGGRLALDDAVRLGMGETEPAQMCGASSQPA